MRNNYAVLFVLLNKRLFKKPSFVIILCMIPLVVFGLKLISKQESGIVRIALVDQAKDSAEAASGARDIIDHLMDNDSVFLYSECVSEEEALKQLEIDSIDAIWVFPKDYDERVAAFTQGLITEQAPADAEKKGNGKDRKRIAGKGDNAVTVIEREDNVLLQLARMELFGSMYSDLSYSLFENFIDLRLTGEKNPDSTANRMYYDNDRNSGSLFKYRDYDGTQVQAQGNGYLFTPVRGMLLLLLLLGGLAAAMYYRDDLDKEIFTWMPVGNRWIFEHIYLMTALLDSGLVVFVTFMITGLGGNIIRELALMVLYLLSACCFCSIVRKITPGLKSLATLIPILLLAMLVICPVFIYIRQLKVLQLICPPFYYLMADNNPRYLLYFALYTAVIIVVDVLTDLGSRCSG
ncbi:MAG: ABC transporter permease [Lachnospiraceae bacterium]|nr:ABC transporter permease [Lachnospiraceae bacterium]